MADQVVLVGPAPPPTGGIATHVASLARALGAAGIAASAVDPRQRLRLVGELSRAGLRGEVVHLHVCGHNRKSYGLLGACLAATPRLAAMVTLHSGLLPGFLEDVTASGRRTIAGLLGRASAVVCVSERIAEAIAALGVRGVDVAPAFIPGGRPGRPPVRVAAAREAGATILAATVAPGPEYGADLLVHGFARVAHALPDAVLVVFGSGGADREVAARLAERELGERVIAAGEVDSHTALAILAAADVVLRPTLADGDAVTVREARALGRRVVASDAAARPPGTTLFPAGDTPALAEAILRALREPPPPAFLDDGFAALSRVYARLGLDGLEVPACAASPAV
jgi:glycogen(starch) synthase